MPHQLAFLPAQVTSDLVASFRLRLDGLPLSDFVTQLAHAIVDDVSLVCTIAALPPPAVALLRFVTDITALVRHPPLGVHDDRYLFWAAHKLNLARIHIRSCYQPYHLAMHSHALVAANIAVVSLAKTRQDLRLSQMWTPDAYEHPDDEELFPAPPLFHIVDQHLVLFEQAPPVFDLDSDSEMAPESADVSTVQRGRRLAASHSPNHCQGHLTSGCVVGLALSLQATKQPGWLPRRRGGGQWVKARGGYQHGLG